MLYLLEKINSKRIVKASSQKQQEMGMAKEEDFFLFISFLFFKVGQTEAPEVCMLFRCKDHTKLHIRPSVYMTLSNPI